MFLCLPIIFIISISEMRSDKSFSVASAAAAEAPVGVVPPTPCSPSPRHRAGPPPGSQHHLHLSIFTATLVTRFGLSLSRPMASASTTCPKHPSPRGLPRISLPGGRTDGRPDAGGRTAGRRPAPLPPRSALTCPGAAPSAGPRGARTRRRRPAWGCRWRRGARAAPASRPSSWRSWSQPTPAAGPWVTFSWCLGPRPAAPAGGKALTGALRPPWPCPDPQHGLRARGPCSAASSRSATKLF